MLAGIAVIIDLLIGGWVAKWVPSLDDLLNKLASILSKKLNRKGRSNAALRMRGGIILIIMVPALWLIGAAANHLSHLSMLGNLVSIILLLPLIGQKKSWLEISNRAALQPNEDPHVIAQVRTQKTVLHFGLSYLANIVVLLVGGLALLIPFRFLSAMSTDAKNLSKRSDPFFSALTRVYTLLSLPAVILGCSLFVLARFFLINTHLNPFSGSKSRPRNIAFSNFWLLHFVAEGLKISFKQTIGHRSANKVIWIGPTDGVAKLTGDHVRKTWYLVLVSTSFSYLLGLMLYVYLAAL